MLVDDDSAVSGPEAKRANIVAMMEERRVDEKKAEEQQEEDEGYGELEDQIENGEPLSVEEKLVALDVEDIAM